MIRDPSKGRAWLRPFRPTIPRDFDNLTCHFRGDMRFLLYQNGLPSTRPHDAGRGEVINTRPGKQSRIVGLDPPSDESVAPCTRGTRTGKQPRIVAPRGALDPAESARLPIVPRFTSEAWGECPLNTLSKFSRYKSEFGITFTVNASPPSQQPNSLHGK
jgi:hypothetical protein